MKKILIVLLVAVLGVFQAHAQKAKMPVVDEIAQVEDSDGNIVCAVFSVKKDGATHYYLDAGNLGVGNDVIQIGVDPLFKLYIPLGQTVNEAIETMEELRDRYKADNGSSIEKEGNLAPFLPNGDVETVKITTRKGILGKSLEFSLQRDGYIRANFIAKSDFGNLLTNFKLNRKWLAKHEQ